MSVKIKTSETHLFITWQLSKLELPFSEIKSVSLDDTYGGSEKNAIRIGTPYGTTDRLLIHTTQDAYILFTSRAEAMKHQIDSHLQKS